MSYYYLSENNQSVGPMALATICKMADTGIVKASVLVCEAGSNDWVALSQVRSLNKPEPPKPPRTPPPPQRPRKQATQRLGPRQKAPPPRAAEDEPDARYPDWFPLASTVGGITAVVFICAPFISFLLGAAALTMGVIGYREGGKGKSHSLAGISTGSFALAVSLGAFLFDGAFLGSSDAAAIEQVLKRVARVEREAEKRFPGDTVAQARHYSRELRRIDTGACPSEFRVAYQDVIAAWDNAIPYLAADTPLTWFLEGFYGGFTQDYSVVGLTSYQARAATQRLAESYQTLRRIAALYGARIPHH